MSVVDVHTARAQLQGLSREEAKALNFTEHKPSHPMTKIYKYPLEVTDLQTLNLPHGAKILSVIVQSGTVMLYAMVNPIETHTQGRVIEVVGTGNPMQDDIWGDRVFIGTVQTGPFVWHIFERTRP